MAEKIEIDVSKALRDIASLTSGLDGLQKKAVSAGKAIDDAFDEGVALGVADAIRDLQKEYDQLKNSANTLRSALKNATNPDAIKLYTASIAKLEAGMGRLEQSGKAAGVALKKTEQNIKDVSKEAGTGKQVFENFFGAFTKATIVIAAIDTIRKFTTEALSLAAETAKATKQFQAFTGSAEKASEIVSELTVFANKKIFPTQEIFQAGKSLLAFGEDSENLVPVLSRIADISRATGKDFGELTTIYGKARAAGVLYAEDINQLVDAGIPIIQEFAKQMNVSNDQVKKLASEGKISFQELELAFLNLTTGTGDFVGQAEAGVDAADKFNSAWTNALTQVGTTLKPAWDSILGELTALIENVARLGSSKGFTDFIAKATVASIQFFPVLGSLARMIKKTGGGQQGAFFELPDPEEAKKKADERLKIETDAAEKRKELDKKSSEDALKRARAEALKRAKLAEDSEKEAQRLRFAAMKDGEEKDIALEKFRFEELKKQLQKYHIDTSEAEEQHQLNLLRIGVKYADERFRAELELIELRKAQGEFEAEQFADQLKKERAQLESSRDVRESEITLLEAYFANFIAAMEANGADKEAVAKQQLEFDNRIKAERLQNEINFQEALFGQIDTGDKDAIERAKNSIATLKAQLEGLSIQAPDASGGGGFSLKKLLGLEDGQVDEIERAIGRIVGLFQDLADARVQEAEAQVRAAEESTNAAQEYYDEQYRLNEEGFANDLDLAQRQLAAAKVQEEQALEQKKKAQRQQILLDTALQAVNIATAASNIFKTIPFPLSVALSAIMIGAFVAAKAKALQATKFRDGGEGRVDGTGLIVGRSHAQGGVKFEAEGGEFMGTDGKRFGIVNKRMTAKHFDLLQAVNRDDKLQMRRIVDGMTAPMNRDNVLSASGGVVVIGGGVDNGTHKLLSDWRNESKNRETVTVAGGYLIRRRGNYTRKTKIA